jgi:hypothetical protein
VLLFNMNKQQGNRDKLKAEISKEYGITLVVIPYWWNHSEKFLKTQIASLRPDILPDYKLETAHIPEPQSLHEREVYLPARAQSFNTKEVP